ncbi:signal recognition particle [Shinella sp. H4-D48]|uniref:signal recognition particle n=1 Tax=Shinella sp. H4-D48 TaxID=2925841 RepID=UPI001F53DC30|nr:signal recognition particle [Shinella sp. H4-D48]UNK36584.1 signal recognition particle [Shinella sp. H4-D48]
MVRILGVCAAGCFGTLVFGYGACNADDASFSDVAHQLGNVIASEQPCGLSYNQDAIAKYIEDNVSDEAMGFASMLDLMTRGAAASIEELTNSGKTAHCAQTRRVAKRYGFIK